MNIKKLFLLFLFISFLVAPVRAHAWDWSFSGFKTAVFDYVSSVREKPGKLLPVALFGGLGAILGYKVYKHQTRPTVVKHLDPEKYLGSGTVSIGNLIFPGQKINFTGMREDDQKREDSEQEWDEKDQEENGAEITVQQLKVYYQHAISGGGNASCGYHTVKNLLALQHIFSDSSEVPQSEAKKMLSGSEYIQRYFGKGTSDWRKDVVAQRKKKDGEEYFERQKGAYKKGDWLEAGEVEQLLENNLVSNKEEEEDDTQKNYTVIKNMDLLVNASLDDSMQRDKFMMAQLPKNVPTLESLAKMPKPYIHLFAVSTAHQRRTNAHWFGVVLRATQAKREYTVVDSKNSVLLYGGMPYRKDMSCLKALIGHIEGEGIAQQIKAPRQVLQALEGVLDAASTPDCSTQILLDRYKQWGGNSETAAEYGNKLESCYSGTENKKYLT